MCLRATRGEMRFEKNESAFQDCSLAGGCLGNGSRRRTVRCLEEQRLLDAQRHRLDNEQQQRSNKVHKNRARFADSRSHRDAKMLHAGSLPLPETEIGMLVVHKSLSRSINWQNASCQPLPKPDVRASPPFKVVSSQLPVTLEASRICLYKGKKPVDERDGLFFERSVYQLGMVGVPTLGSYCRANRNRNWVRRRNWVRHHSWAHNHS